MTRAAYERLKRKLIKERDVRLRALDIVWEFARTQDDGAKGA